MKLFPSKFTRSPVVVGGVILFAMFFVVAIFVAPREQPTLPVISPSVTKNPRDPKDVAIENSTAYLKKLMATFEVVNSTALFNDRELQNVSYPITVMLVVRFQTPYGYVKRPATFACDANGNVIQMIDAPAP